MNAVANYILMYVGIAIFCGLIMLGLFKLIGHSIAIAKEKKLQDNPDTFGLAHDGTLWRVKKVIREKGIILLSMNPSVNFPSGKGRYYFTLDEIPPFLREEYKVFRITKLAGVGISFIEEKV